MYKIYSGAEILNSSQTQMDPYVLQKTKSRDLGDGPEQEEKQAHTFPLELLNQHLRALPLWPNYLSKAMLPNISLRVRFLYEFC